jgi:hypothetical protein
LCRLRLEWPRCRTLIGPLAEMASCSACGLLRANRYDHGRNSRHPLLQVLFQTIERLQVNPAVVPRLFDEIRFEREWGAAIANAVEKARAGEPPHSLDLETDTSNLASVTGKTVRSNPSAITWRSAR